VCAEYRRKACFSGERIPLSASGVMSIAKPNKSNLIYGAAGVAIGGLAVWFILKSRK
jgi:hypothetical protein